MKEQFVPTIEKMLGALRGGNVSRAENKTYDLTTVKDGGHTPTIRKAIESLIKLVRGFLI